MRIRRRRTITIETNVAQLLTELLPDPSSHPCPLCAADVPMLPPEAVARLCGVTVRAIYRQLEAGLCHFVETSEGRIFVCLTAFSGPRSLPPAPD